MSIGYALHGGYLLLAAALNSDTASFHQKPKRNGGFDFISSKPPPSIERTIAHKQRFYMLQLINNRIAINRFQKERTDNRIFNLRVIGSASVRLAL